MFSPKESAVVTFCFDILQISMNVRVPVGMVVMPTLYVLILKDRMFVAAYVAFKEMVETAQVKTIF